ncbi:TonB-dependent receptor [Flagellimonas allohymeniacidonis]|uniref:TonB-dependent receptor n=1 Tax=Flagellimonas allohymeniacidonis TaxID=2517819 RepID=A0A4Q8QMK7_9FLAO|nr:TonB-dependent receptor [Allomuricauda hymeniacidonis]TAI49546.1 TonB-dependent receptor [Allomuricauda hymeniacidonis]
MCKRINIISIFFLSLWGGISAQETDNIGTETVTVVKPYSPTVSDAFKLKSSPQLDDSIVLQKKKINYSIFSVPVASTFTPAKGRASRVKKTPPPTLFNSYASIGLGNFNNALVDVYTSREFNRGENLLDVGLSHHSSRGDIESTPLDADFYNTSLDVSYAKKDRDLDWGASLGLQHQLYNWYGVEQGEFDETVISSLDETQNYFNAEAKAHLNLEDSFFKKGNILLRRFWDATDSGENRVVLQPTIELPITEELVTIKTKVDYVNGSFENTSLNNTVNDSGINYSQFQVGVTPSLLILRDDLTLNLGANLVFGSDLENSDSSFFIYPAVTASYRLLDESVIAYGGIEGELRQNSYYDFVQDNPYVSPTLEIQPTDQQYEGYLGLKGQLLSNVGYNIKGSYTAENRRPLFLLNPENLFRTDDKGYFYGNSFQVFYDDLKTLGIFAELNVDVNRNFTFGINAEFYDYDTETDNPAWNLPSIKGSLFMDYQVNKQWYFGANLFYVGERDDLVAQALENALPSEFPASIVTLDGFFDVNAHAGYRFNDQLTIFVKASNIANNDYQRWANFRVQTFQALAGVSYKFDF